MLLSDSREPLKNDKMSSSKKSRKKDEPINLYFIEAHKFGKKIFDTINQHLQDKRFKLKEGTIVDATIIEAPTSTKN
jgi:hypothetical protein